MCLEMTCLESSQNLSENGPVQVGQSEHARVHLCGKSVLHRPATHGRHSAHNQVCVAIVPRSRAAANSPASGLVLCTNSGRVWHTTHRLAPRGMEEWLVLLQLFPRPA